MIYYKVVSPDLKSIVVSQWRRKELARYSVQYKINEWVSANIEDTPLMVFNNLTSAAKFAAPRTARIYECKIRGKRKHGCIAMNLNYVQEYTAKYLECKRRKKALLKRLYYHAPEGTVFCKYVKLIKEI